MIELRNLAATDVDLSGCDRRLHIYHNRGFSSGGVIPTVGADVTLREETGSGSFGALGLPRLRGTHDVALFDIDNDGDIDLYLTTVAEGRNRLYINDGAGVFTEEGLSRNAALDRPAHGNDGRVWRQCACLDGTGGQTVASGKHPCQTVGLPRIKLCECQAEMRQKSNEVILFKCQQEPVAHG